METRLTQIPYHCHPHSNSLPLSPQGLASMETRLLFIASPAIAPPAIASLIAFLVTAFPPILFPYLHPLRALRVGGGGGSLRGH